MMLKTFAKSTLRGVGQVMLQENALSGFVMLVGIAYNSLYLAGLALVATLLATLFASLMRYDSVHIERGLYGYNATLVGIACGAFLESSPLFLPLLILLTALATYLTHLSLMRQRLLPTLTAPFVVVTWLLLLLVYYGQPYLLPLATVAPHTLDHGIISTLGIGMGQIMLQGNEVTGYLFLLALLINSRRDFGYAVLASLLMLLLLFVRSFDYQSIQLGLYEYNAVLVAIALASSGRRPYMQILLGLLLAAVMQYLGIRWGLPTLTAPFVLAVWVVTLLQKPIHRRS